MADEPKKVRGVYEHPKGSDIWWIQYFEHGLRHRERVGRRSHAIDLYRKRKTQILVGTKLPELNKKRVTFGDLIDGVLDYAREHKLKMRNYEDKAGLLRPAFGARTAEDIRPDEFTRWITRRGGSEATFNRYRAFLSVCYREGERLGKISINPARLIRLKKERNERLRFLTRQEFEKLAERIGARFPTRPRHRAAFVVSVHTGMRLSEQYGLEERMLDWEENYIRLPGWLCKNKEPRDIPMNSIVREELERIRSKQPKPTDKMFPRERGGKARLNPTWFKKVLQECRNEGSLVIEAYTWHNNRHTFCSWLALEGCSLVTIQKLAGHKDIAMSARYSHLSPDHKRSEIERLVQPRPKVVEIPRSATRTAIG